MSDSIIRSFQVDRARVYIYPTARGAGEASGLLAADLLRSALAARGSARILVGTGNSQIEMVNKLAKAPGLDWRRVEMFHMDEYIGLPEEHPASFRRWLKTRLVDVVHPGKAHLICGTAPNLDAECERYAALLHKGPIEICFLGFGENGHIAFNDPGVADFHDPRIIKRVAMDERCRQQQVGEGHFPSIDAMPREALTLTIPELMRASHLICTVPELRKAEAVRNALTGPIAESCPSSIVRTHPGTTMFLDPDSASLLPKSGWPPTT
jgi:glucosamine-6-phosphate deaminase